MPRPLTVSTNNRLGALVNGIASVYEAVGQSYVSSKATPVKTTADLGVRIREARKAMDLSQQAFADLAGVGRRFVSELEAGKASLEFERVLKVCQAAGIDIVAMPRVHVLTHTQS